MAIANVDELEAHTAIFDAMEAADAVTNIIGSSPMRMFSRMPAGTRTFPFVRMDFIEAPVFQGLFGKEWFRSFTVRFVSYTLNRSAAVTSDLNKAMQDVMDDIAGTAITTGFIAHYQPGPSFVRWEPDAGGWVGMVEYTITTTQSRS